MTTIQAAGHDRLLQCVASYMIVHMLTASLHLAAMTPALTEQLNHARKTSHGGQ